MNQSDRQKKTSRQPSQGITFAEMLAEADAVQDQVWLSQRSQKLDGGFYPIMGSIQSALAAVMQPVPWLGLQIGHKKPRRL